MDRVHSARQEPVSIPSELVERLEAASAGSRELDISLAMETTYPYGFDSEREIDAYPHPTTCLGDALALAERVLPGWCWLVERHKDGSASVTLDEWSAYSSGPFVQGATPALAVCIAILRATTASSVGTSASECTQTADKIGEGG